MIKAEVSLYPADHRSISELEHPSFRFLDEQGLDYDFHYGTTSINTTFSGPPDHVWNALRRMFQENNKLGQDVVMVATVTNYD